MDSVTAARIGPRRFYVRCFKQGDSALWTIKVWGGNRIGAEISVADHYPEKERQLWFGDSIVAIKLDAPPVNGWNLHDFEVYRGDLAWYSNRLYNAKDQGNSTVTRIVEALLIFEYVPELRPGFYKPGIEQDFAWDKVTVKYPTPEQIVALGLA